MKKLNQKNRFKTQLASIVLLPWLITGCIEFKSKGTWSSVKAAKDIFFGGSASEFATGSLAIGTEAIENLKLDLGGAQLTEKQINIVIEGAKAELESRVGALVVPTMYALTSENPSTLSFALSSVIAGAMKALPNPDANLASGDDKAVLAKSITTSTFGSVEKLGGGLEQSILTTAASEIISSVMQSLPEAGLSGENISKGVAAITSGAVASLANSGFSPESVNMFTKSVVSSTVAEISKIDLSSSGFKNTQMMNVVTSEAVGALGASDAGSELTIDLIGSITAGSVQGLGAWELSSDDAKEMFSEITQSTIANLGELNLDTAAMDLAMQSATKESISALVSSGFDQELVDEGVGAITTGAMLGINGISDDKKSFGTTDMIKNIMSSAMAGLSSSQSENQEDMNKLAKNIMEDAMTSLKEVEFNTNENINDAVSFVIKGGVEGLANLSKDVKIANFNAGEMLGELVQSASGSLVDAGIGSTEMATILDDIKEMSVSVAMTSGIANKDNLAAIAGEISGGMSKGLEAMAASGQVTAAMVETNKAMIENTMMNTIQSAAATSGVVINDLEAILAQVQSSLNPNLIPPLPPTPTPTPTSPPPPVDNNSEEEFFGIKYHDFPEQINIGKELWGLDAEVMGNVTSCSIVPPLPLGLSINNRCQISGIPTALKGPDYYTITSSNGTLTDSIGVFGLEVVMDSIDRTPPRVESIVFTKSLIDVSQTESKIIVRIKVRDDHGHLPTASGSYTYPFMNIGFFNASNPYGHSRFEVPAGTPDSRDLSKTCNGYECEILVEKTFYPGTQPGNYSISYVGPGDTANNHRWISHDELKRMLNVNDLPSFVIANNANVDLQLPVLDQLTLTPIAQGTADASKGNVKVHVKVHDNYPFASDYVSNNMGSGAIRIRLQNLSNTSDTGVSSGDLTRSQCQYFNSAIPPYMECDLFADIGMNQSFYLSEYTVVDRQGNELWWSVDEDNLGANTQQIVQNSWERSIQGCTSGPCGGGYSLDYNYIPERINFGTVAILTPRFDSNSSYSDCHVTSSLAGFPFTVSVVANTCVVNITPTSVPSSDDDYLIMIEGKINGVTVSRELEGLRPVAATEDATPPTISSISFSPNTFLLDNSLPYVSTDITVQLSDLGVSTPSHDNKYYLNFTLGLRSETTSPGQDGQSKTVQGNCEFSTFTSIPACTITLSGVKFYSGTTLGRWYIDWLDTHDGNGNNRHYQRSELGNLVNSSLCAAIPCTENPALLFSAATSGYTMTDLVAPTISMSESTSIMLAATTVDSPGNLSVWVDMTDNQSLISGPSIFIGAMDIKLINTVNQDEHYFQSRDNTTLCQSVNSLPTRVQCQMYINLSKTTNNVPNHYVITGYKLVDAAGNGAFQNISTLASGIEPNWEVQNMDGGDPVLDYGYVPNRMKQTQVVNLVPSLQNNPQNKAIVACSISLIQGYSLASLGLAFNSTTCGLSGTIGSGPTTDLYNEFSITAVLTSGPDITTKIGFVNLVNSSSDTTPFKVSSVTVGSPSTITLTNGGPTSVSLSLVIDDDSFPSSGSTSYNYEGLVEIQLESQTKHQLRFIRSPANTSCIFSLVSGIPKCFLSNINFDFYSESDTGIWEIKAISVNDPEGNSRKWESSTFIGNAISAPSIVVNPGIDHVTDDIGPLLKTSVSDWPVLQSVAPISDSISVNFTVKFEDNITTFNSYDPWGIELELVNIDHPEVYFHLGQPSCTTPLSGQVSCTFSYTRSGIVSQDYGIYKLAHYRLHDRAGNYRGPGVNELSPLPAIFSIVVVP